MLRILRSLPFVLAVALLAAPAAANAATKKKKTKAVYPTVSSISPRKIAIGQKLTIKGAHFRAGKGKSSVAFYKSGKPVIFIKADSATSTKLVITIPAKLATLLAQSDGAAKPTMLRMRVIGTKMGRAWTQNSRSPIVAPAPKSQAIAGAPGAPDTPAAIAAQQAAQYNACQVAAAANPSGDQDADGVTNGTEAAYHLDPCNPDTDGDTLEDGYEVDSALDLNGAAVPYPAKRPWPNPLDPTDVTYDFDGDGLSLAQEHELWQATKTGFPVRAYSDGTQNSGGSQPVTNLEQSYLDLDGDGNLTDDERDEDGDGLSNMVEMNYTGTQNWWANGPFKAEAVYARRAFADTDAIDPDSDGDGILDGADDQDADGWSNFVESQLMRERSGYRVQPFNPCLPDPHSLTCSRYVILGGKPWPPFDGTELLDNPADPTDDATASAIPFGYPDTAYQGWVTAGSHDFVTGWTWGSWDPSPWFTAAWDGYGGPQGP
ncbi:MAG TPA: IPT/TIG domain-containing protein [Baekduia sp.]